MAKTYLPTRDADLLTWMQNFVTYAAANQAALGLTLDQVDEVTAAQTDLLASFNAHVAAAAAAKSATTAKGTQRRTSVATFRNLVNVLQIKPTLTDAQRESLGITVHKSGKTPVPVPTSSPNPEIDRIERFAHHLRIEDNATNRAAKPDGVEGAEIWMKVVPAGGPAPVVPDELAFAGYASTTKVTREFDPADAGSTAYYRLRWVNTKGKYGPWSVQVGATIAA